MKPNMTQKLKLMNEQLNKDLEICRGELEIRDQEIKNIKEIKDREINKLRLRLDACLYSMVLMQNIIARDNYTCNSQDYLAIAAAYKK